MKRRNTVLREDVLHGESWHNVYPSRGYAIGTGHNSREDAVWFASVTASVQYRIHVIPKAAKPDPTAEVVSHLVGPMGRMG